MEHITIILNILVFTIVYTSAQTVYIDIDSGKIVGVDDGKRTQANYPNQQYYPNYGRPRGHLNYPNQRPYYPSQPAPQPNNQQRSGTQSLNAEWVCRNSATGDMMIIANEGINRYGQFFNSNGQNQYQENPWLQSQNPPVTEPNVYQSTPSRIFERQSTFAPTEEPQTPPPPPSTSSKRPFPKLDDIDWTKYLEQTTKQPAKVGSLSAAIDGEGIIQPRTN